MQGWIKLHRKIQEKGYYTRSQYVHLWIHLLLSVNHKEKEIMWNKNIIIIKAGQFVTGRKKLSEETGIPERTIEDILTLFEKEQQIQQQKTTKFRLITVINWDNHQALQQQANNKPTTSQHKQECNNDKNTERVILKNKKGEDLTSMKASEYTPDGWSPLDRKKMLRSLARSLGDKKTNEWSQLLFGSAWDFKKGFAHFQGYEYPDTILLDEVSKTLAKWYELGETRDTIRDMMTAFFKGKKAGAVTITPNSVFSSHTYNSWKQNKL